MQSKPTTLTEYKGQDRAKRVLWPAIEAARLGKQLSHILLSGPPGVGKTTLATCIANELGVSITKVDARSITSMSDFLHLIQPLNDNDILFVDEIHGLDKALEEIMYGVLTDFCFPIKIKDRFSYIPINRFVLMGATTKPHGLTAPLRSRFQLTAQLELYSVEQLIDMCFHKCAAIGFFIDEEAAEMLSQASRGTARILEGLISRVHDLVFVSDDPYITKDMATEALYNQGIDADGLNEQDRRLLHALKVMKGQPVGISALASMIGDSQENIEEVIEPFLIQRGFVLRTTRGRVLSEYGVQRAA